MHIHCSVKALLEYTLVIADSSNRPQKSASNRPHTKNRVKANSKRIQNGLKKVSKRSQNGLKKFSKRTQN